MRLAPCRGRRSPAVAPLHVVALSALLQPFLEKVRVPEIVAREHAEHDEVRMQGLSDGLVDAQELLWPGTDHAQVQHLALRQQVPDQLRPGLIELDSVSEYERIADDDDIGP